MTTAAGTVEVPVAAPPPNERGLGALVRHTRFLAVRNLRLFGNVRSLFSVVVFPLVFLFGFLAVLNRLLDARGIDAVTHLVPAIVVQAMFFSAIASAFFLSADRGSGMLARCRSLPIHRGSIIGARLVADAARATVATLVVVGAGYALGFRFEAGPFAALAFLVVAVAFALVLAAGAGTIGLASTDSEAVAATLTLPYLPLMILSSAFAPVEAFPDWLEPIVAASPVTATIEALRALASGGPTVGPLWQAGAWLVGLLAVFSYTATRAFRRAA